jgi:hypothetical protein
MPLVYRLASTSGYFLKCPLCNNKEKFEQEMKQYGVFVPEKVLHFFALERYPYRYHYYKRTLSNCR